MLETNIKVILDRNLIDTIRNGDFVQVILGKAVLGFSRILFDLF